MYAIDFASGFATPIGAPFSPPWKAAFGVDFNPQADRIRVVSDAGQNRRINPYTGVAVNYGPLAYAATDQNAGQTPNVVGAAYVNNVPRAPSTALYDIDSILDMVVPQTPPNDGTLNTVGPLFAGPTRMTCSASTSRRCETFMALRLALGTLTAAHAGGS